MDKFLVTPVTMRKKRPMDDLLLMLTDDDEDIDDINYDLDEADIISCTQAYVIVQGDEEAQEEEDAFFQNDGLTTTHDFTQEEQDPEESDMPPPERIEAFHKDTEEQVSIDDLGLLRIFKLGESFTSDLCLGRLCHQQNVPIGVKDAVYTIRKFYNDNLVKTADCRVRIPVCHTFHHASEQARVRERYPNQMVTLAKTERIRLKNLRHLLPLNASLDDDLLYSFTPGIHYNFAIEEQHTLRGSFYVPPPGTNITVLELFAGAGGMSTGFINAGFDVRWMVEKDPQAAATLKLNHQKGNARVFEESVENFLKKAQAGKRCYPRPDQVHHIHASSPCQGNLQHIDCDFC